MSRPNLEEGFGFWREEVVGLERPEEDVPYIPIIALVGVYVASDIDPEKLTSFHWRRAVLGSRIAVDGLRASLSSFHRDEVDETYEIPLEHLIPDETVTGGQLRHAYASLIHGMPESITSLPANEVFLGQTLGFAQYDHGVAFYPSLDLTDQGRYALQNSYPETAEYVRKVS